MKNLTILMLFFSSFIFSQQHIGYYQSPLMEEFEVKITEMDKRGNFEYFIYAQSVDPLSSKCVLRIRNKQIDDFVIFLKKLKSNHIDWVQKANENNISEIDREIKISHPKMYAGSFLYTEWHTDNTIEVVPLFKSLPVGLCTVLFSSDLVSSSNNYIRSKGFTFVFTNEKDFDSLIELLSKEKLEEHLSDQKRKENIFKN